MAETSRNEDRIKVQATFRLPLFTLQPTLPKRASRQARIVQCKPSRWRTKGSLVNYTPLLARAEPDDFDRFLQ
ncbi:hypothetical protein HanRHA438_Chr16g0744541 [Helianthus annuus]|nr:hypothetical protein HanOQP8_Chr16g0604551 [Helianthus annuus]KAJ0819947.1 hypothetical protein HanPSC8_Chr16g0701991 [Helianthus annuus]KAJ0834520.1 hypothetical protein HanRHA438_Chr16g0744541 [Helianthus annuus]